MKCTLTYTMLIMIGKYLEHEGHDISEIYLPGHQLNLLTDAEIASGNGNKFILQLLWSY